MTILALRALKCIGLYIVHNAHCTCNKTYTNKHLNNEQQHKNVLAMNLGSNYVRLMKNNSVEENLLKLSLLK